MSIDTGAIVTLALLIILLTIVLLSVPLDTRIRERREARARNQARPWK